jgi:signal transduction histidine kinase
MQRMIEQLLDIARARLSDGIPVTRIRQDIVPLATKIVEEVRAANPGRTIEVQGQDGGCGAYVDADRFEQVVSNLLGNAIAHGDAGRPITVAVGARDGMAAVSVHNFGKPIDPTVIPTLFDPFKRAQQSRGAGDGLGLGLYIVERIVNAHGGSVTVQSAPHTGTRFEVTFPLAMHV